MTDVWVSDRPLEDFGCVVSSLRGWWSLPPVAWDQLPVPRRAGAWITTGRAQAAQIQIGLRLTGSTLTGRRAQLSALYAAVRGRTRIRTNDDPTRFRWAVLVGGEGQGLDPVLVEPRLDVVLDFLAADPWFYAQVPTTLAIPVGTRVTVTGGTAPHRGVLDLTGAGTDPCVVIQRDRAGNELARLTITTTWANTAVVRCDFTQAQIKKYTGAVIADFEDEIAATEVPFTFDPDDGPHTLEYTGAASALYTFRKADLA
jgi:hypothetical protein